MSSTDLDDGTRPGRVPTAEDFVAAQASPEFQGCELDCGAMSFP